MKKRFLTLLACLSLGIVPFTSCGDKETPATPEEPTVPESLKILCIGNSFSQDTVEYLAQIALGCGVKDVTVGNLYYGGCSVNKHLNHAQNDVKAYEYSTNDGSGWVAHGMCAIDATVQSDEWDWISIQHGTGDGSKYADAESYVNLQALIEHVKALASEDTQIAFNMTWVGEANSNQEMTSFGNSHKHYYQAISATTQETVAAVEGIDRISPTGTAIYNARTTSVRPLFRDGYHLSLDNGRYIAGLTFFAALTDIDIATVSFAPEGMSAYTKAAAIESAQNAVKTPYAQTASGLNEEEFGTG